MHGRLDIAGAGADLPHVPRRAADLDLGRAARAASGRQLAGDRLSRPARSTFTGWSPGAGGYLAFVGRISPEKRVDRAVEIARRLGMPLKIAAKIDGKDRDYFESEIKPLFADPLVEFVGEIGEDAEERVPGRRGGAAVPDRLAGAVRAGHDRGDGVRHAGRRVSLRLGARGDARRRVGLRRRHDRRGGGGHGARRGAAARGRARLLRGAVLGAAHGGGLRRDLRGDDRERASPPRAGADRVRAGGDRRGGATPTAATGSTGWAAKRV